MSTFTTVSILMLTETAVLGVPAVLAAVWAQRHVRGSAPQPRGIPAERPLPEQPDRANVSCRIG